MTTDTATQHQIVDQLQQVVLSDVPFIPITEDVGWFQYNTADFTGWPSPSDPYAFPPPTPTPTWARCCCTSRRSKPGPPLDHPERAPTR